MRLVRLTEDKGVTASNSEGTFTISRTKTKVKITSSDGKVWSTFSDDEEYLTRLANKAADLINTDHNIQFVANTMDMKREK